MHFCNFIHLNSPLLPKPKSKSVWLSVQLSSDSPSPPALSSSPSLPLRFSSFLSFSSLHFFSPPTICRQCKQSNFPSICLSFLLVSAPPPPPPPTQFSPMCLIRTSLSQGANKRPVEGHPGSFQPRHGPYTLPTGRVPGLHKNTSRLQRYVLPPHFPPSFSTPSHTVDSNR